MRRYLTGILRLRLRPKSQVARIPAQRRIVTVPAATMPNEIKDLHTVDESSFPYIYEQNVAVPLKVANGLIRCNVYRPKGTEPVPVLVTYGPYGKDIHYKE